MLPNSLAEGRFARYIAVAVADYDLTVSFRSPFLLFRCELGVRSLATNDLIIAAVNRWMMLLTNVGAERSNRCDPLQIFFRFEKDKGPW